MFLKRDRRDLEALKQEAYPLKPARAEGSLLFWVISRLFLTTLVLMVFFWVASGNNQLKLVGELAYREALELGNQLVSAWGGVSGSRAAEFQKSLPPSAQLRWINTGKPPADGDSLPEKRGMNDAVMAQQLHEVRHQAFHVIVDIFRAETRLYIPAVNKEPNLVAEVTAENPLLKEEISGFFRLGAAVLLLVLLIMILYFFLLRRRIIRPIEKLAVATHAFGSGDFSVRIGGLKSEDELGALSATFDTMAGSLAEKTGKLNEALKMLERKYMIMQIELDLASSIQQGIIPGNFSSAGLTAVTAYHPLEKVSGDFYDFFDLPDGARGIIISDASGHGVPAALITMLAKSFFRETAELSSSTADFMEKINKRLFESVVTSDYMTAFYMKINPDLTAEFTSAGHVSPYLIRQGRDGLTALESDGIFVGAMKDPPVKFSAEKLKLEKGDRIIFFTDGIIEAMTPELEIYGYDRFMDSIGRHRKSGPAEFLRGVLDDMREFLGEHELKDDLTVVVLDIS